MRSWFQSIAAACFSLLISGQLDAQPLFGSVESLEAIVANSDLVLVGKITGVEDMARVGGQGNSASVDVELTIKGEGHPRIGVFVSQPPAVLEGWKNRSSRLLIATKEERPDATIIELTKGMSTVMAADFTIVQEPDDVIRIAKETAARQPAWVKRFHTFRLRVPPSPAIAKTEWGKLYRTGGGVSVSVPVDERLEKRALEYIRTGNPMQREEGAAALRYSKSDENIKLLKSLLSDPSWGLSERAEDNLGIEVRVYSVRARAYETLKAWSVDVPEPVSEESLTKLDVVTRVFFSLGDVGDVDLRALSRFKNLESLTLHMETLTVENLKAIGSLTKLRSLDFLNSEVTDAGLPHLAALTNLRYLDVRGTQVTFEGLKILTSLESLEKLLVSRKLLTDEQKAELRRLRPNLEIEH